MQRVTSFQASAIPPEQLTRIVADYIALDRARIFRRLLVMRFGLLALVASLAGSVVHGLSSIVRWTPAAVLLIPPAWAWISELRLARGLSQRLDGVESAVTHKVTPVGPAGVRKS